jgi:hypothetical protein
MSKSSVKTIPIMGNSCVSALGDVESCALYCHSAAQAVMSSLRGVGFCRRLVYLIWACYLRFVRGGMWVARTFPELNMTPSFTSRATTLSIALGALTSAAACAPSAAPVEAEASAAAPAEASAAAPAEASAAAPAAVAPVEGSAAAPVAPTPQPVQMRYGGMMRNPGQ